MKVIADTWRRRYWRHDEAALSRLSGTRPAVVVTGASKGIGLELARTFAQRRPDSTIVLIARDQGQLDRAADQLRRTLSPERAANIATVACDVTAPDAAAEIAQALSKQDLFVDELINNAGIGLSGRFSDHDAAAIDNLVALNITALNQLTRAFLPDMRVRGRGGIINVASLGGFTPGPYQAAYYASKAYVISLTQALAYENRGKGIRFTVVAPGPVETHFHAEMDAERAFYRRFLPALTPAHVAKTTFFWYRFGNQLVVPGVFNSVLACALRIVPGVLTLPIVALLLNPHDNAPRDNPRNKTGDA